MKKPAVKLKINQKALQQFFLEHTEKIVFGLVVLCFLLFAYKALSRQGYAKKPTDLTAAATSAEAHIAQPVPTPEWVEYPDYPRMIPQGTENSVDYRAYAMKDWFGPYVFPRQRRGMPELLAVKDLRATPGRGSLKMTAGNEATSGQHWVVLTGVVPAAEQLAKFRETFRGTNYPTPHDTPEYLSFVVERVETAVDGTGKPSPRKQFLSRDMVQDSEKWGHAPEVVKNDFTNGRLTSPLPARTDKDWGDEVISLPEIPRMSNEKPEEKPGPAPKGGPIDIDTAGPEGKPPTEPLHAGSGQVPAGDKEKAAQKILFRFFDFTAEPGKQYHYRVFVVLRNPNYGVPVGYLQPPDIGKSKYLGGDLATTPEGVVFTADKYGKWSPALGPIRLPSDTNVLLASMTRVRPPDDLNAKVRIAKWSKQTGQIKKENLDAVARGKVIDPPSEQAPIGQVAVDITGGEMLSMLTPARDRTLTRPGEMLVLNDEGDLVIHDEIADSAAIAQLERQSEAPPDAPAGGGEPEKRNVRPKPAEGLENLGGLP